MTPFILELIRQVLRWLGVYLMTIGLPAEMAGLLEHPEVVQMLAGAVSYALADGGWLMAKWKQARG